MANLYYISRNYKATNSAASKPKTDCERILYTIGFQNLGFKQTTFASSAVGAVVSFFGITKGVIRLPKNSTLAIQYPLSKYYKYITTVAGIKKCKIVLIIHDVKYLMGKSRDIAREMKKFSCADVIIVHNDIMKKWFEEHGATAKLIPLYMFDYLDNNNNYTAPEPSKNGLFDVVFAGGLGMEKSAFIYKLDALKNNSFHLKLYGSGFIKDDVDPANSIISFEGMFSPDEVAKHIRGSFGLVWNGNSIDECGGHFGQYLLYNNPHKTSLYLLCGLPIIIWDRAAIATVIKERQLGICISSLEELDGKLKNLPIEEYQIMVKNVAEVREQIISGGFLKSAMKKALLELS
ncbi:beta-1,6-galactofuranosyltransferase [Arenibacter sp. F20364]|uniref:beta-1,6-galactofuranosyltransferase n=1 Tax=Arenibacter sp. F20364 TaxID=2926415 RepID=UPI001FF18B82|nr:beta-1,6-galactofuranosyltransferase [Arenibacter sp. F20364]MCK0188439.1 beta-1,6-galactofuranosyltransferase [Arenibacter sp. F20364]